MACYLLRRLSAYIMNVFKKTAQRLLPLVCTLIFIKGANANEG